MTKKLYKKIKRRNGEAFTKTIQNYDNGIFEIPNIDKIVFHAGKTKEDAESILQYLISLKDIKIEEIVKPKDPFKLLKEAGYNAFYADTLEKQNSIKYLYKPDEAICTFNDKHRYENYYIINCVHENAENLDRSDFENPKRQDEYGTSVISIQLAKRGGLISIKNRYNHTVPGCDNTFKSNPDNIIMGLSSALKNYFNVDFSSQETALPNDYVLVDNQIVKQIQEIDGIILSNDCYVKNGEIIFVDRGQGKILMEYFVYDDKTKTLEKIINIRDSFADDFNRDYGGLKTLHLKGNSLFDGEEEIIKCA